MAGPLVVWMLTPSSRAMMLASVVLPRPGGPYSRTWSAASPRWRAATQQDGEVVLDLGLADVLREAVGPKAGLDRHLVGDRSVGRQRAGLIHRTGV